jgi:hypothetical protein
LRGCLCTTQYVTSHDDLLTPSAAEAAIRTM